MPYQCEYAVLNKLMTVDILYFFKTCSNNINSAIAVWVYIPKNAKSVKSKNGSNKLKPFKLYKAFHILKQNKTACSP